MRVLVCGSRNWNDIKKIRDRLSLFSKDTIIIHGGCKGADIIAGNIAKELNFDVIEFPAQWNIYGLRAGPIRNQKMIDETRPDFAIAFHEDINSSKGTKDMIKRLMKHNIQFELIK